MLACGIYFKCFTPPLLTDPGLGVPPVCFQVTGSAFLQQIFEHTHYATHWLGCHTLLRLSMEMPGHLPVFLLNRT